MKEEIPLPLVLLVIFVLVLGPQLLVRTNFFKKTYVYEGRVSDALDGSPLDLVEVRTSDQLTYTDNLGEFKLKLERPGAKIISRPRREYERPEGEVGCRLQKAVWSADLYACAQIVYPQPFDVASRVLAAFYGQGSPTSEEIRVRKEKLWHYLSLESQKIWPSQKFMADLLTPYEETSRRLKVLPLSSRINKEFQPIKEFFYVDRTIKGDLARVEARLLFPDGKEEKKDLYFIREEKLWKYLIPETPRSVQDFNEKSIWVFRKK